MQNILSFDVEDWPQSTLDFDLPVTQRVVDNTVRILDLCDGAAVKGTFFVLGLIAETFPGLVRRIQDSGHEVASHGYDHRPVHAMTPAAFREDLARSRASVEQAAGAAVVGYRAPDFSITRDSLWAFEVLAECGYGYDSSVFPFAGPRYGIPEAFMAPSRVHTPAGDLVEFPLATIQWLRKRLPAAGGGYFRLFPYAWHRTAIAKLNGIGAPATAYFHPYEIDSDEIRTSPHRIPLALRLTQGINRATVQRKLHRLLRGFSWGPARDLLTTGPALTGGRVLDLTPGPAGKPVWRSERLP